ncbi:D-alanyl-D-alanine carboxypeptidase/D-alanyl-D-alanine-endopeptidase [Desulfogranum mediterraneum]|uniref:D-alanyl-D-alanine carboxypeptidase/D-alanyl-D-alanine-endopeptidase n=1 Tax=Desulfogranum mediterraneum TaxID=160661 RepID=UPI0003F4CB93|nr:D-alanyl-D-alanine carboxypeptidase [Desulfogranum mediterraneum]
MIGNRRGVGARIWGLLFSWLLCLLSWQLAPAVCPEYPELIENGGYGVGVVAAPPLAEGCNLDQAYIPASIIKIITAQAAFRILGPSHRFGTEFHLDRSQNLYIRGSGDPLLISEEVRRVVGRLQAHGLRRVQGLFIDDSLLAVEGSPPGSGNSANAYDAPVSATGVNFNTLPIRVDGQGRVSSAEPQTPLLPLMQAVAPGLAPGRHRLNITGRGGVPGKQAARHSAELFAAIMAEAGIAVQGPLGERPVPAGATLLLVSHNPRTLEEVIQAMLRYSSNYIANQLFLACGAKRFGSPATWEKGAAAVAELLDAELSPAARTATVVVDGAGLSRENRVTVRSMLEILRLFAGHGSLLPRQRNVRAKTGTLEGVYNYAGYLGDGSPYVILLNQEKNQRARVLDRLCRQHPGLVHSGKRAGLIGGK